jgi:protein-S-isoprenylcysteine O-methyltransferase Ste14
MEERKNIYLQYLRRVLVLFFIVIIMIFSKPIPLFTYIGIAFVLLGAVIRFWAAGYLPRSKELITAGPYRYTQHPFYLGRLLILTGICIMASLPFFINLVILASSYLIFFLYYLPRKIKGEGRRLKAIHGVQWERYRQSVPILFPKRRGYDEIMGSWSSDRMLINREHYIIIGLAILIFFFLWKSYLAH